MLSKYYPELIDDLYPWNGDDQYKEKIIETFHNVKYNTLYRKIAYGYFFTSNFWYCCKKKKTALENVVTDKDKDDSKENQSESKENQSESKENQSELKENQSESKENQSELKENQSKSKENQGI